MKPETREYRPAASALRAGLREPSCLAIRHKPMKHKKPRKHKKGIRGSALSLSLIAVAASWLAGELFGQEPPVIGNTSTKNESPGSVDLDEASHEVFLDALTSASEKHDYDKAIAGLTGLIEKHPNSAGLYYWRSQFYRRKKETKAARDDLTEATRLRHGVLDYYYDRAECLEDLGDRAGAIGDYTSVLKLKPDHYGALAHRGWHYKKLGKRDLALNDLSKAIEVMSARSKPKEGAGKLENAIEDWTKSTLGICYMKRASLLSEIGRHDDAIKDLTQLIMLEPGDAHDQLLLADAYRAKAKDESEEGKNQAALADVSKAISLLSAPGKLKGNPTQNEKDVEREARLLSTICYTDRFFLLSEMGRHDDAVDDLTRLIGLEPDNLAFPLELADEFRKKGDVARADEMLAALVRKYPKSAEPYRHRALQYASQLFFGRAIEDLNKALELEPQSVACLTLRSHCNVFSGFFDRAEADAEAAMRAEPANPAGRRSRAVVRMARKDFHGALDDLAEAARAQPSDSWTLDTRSRILSTSPDGSIRNAMEALASATQACELTHWNDPWTLDTLAAAYAEAGDFAAAIEWETKALSLTENNSLTRPGMERRRTFFLLHTPVRETFMRARPFHG